MPRCERCRNYVTGGRGHARGCTLDGRPVGRRRRTVREAQAEASARRRREEAELRRRLDRNRRLVAARKRALLRQPPGQDAGLGELDQMAVAIHNAYDWQGHGDQCVTAVVRLRDTTYMVFTQRRMEAMAAYIAQHYAHLTVDFKPGGGSHLHAEMYAVLHFLANGQNPAEQIEAIGTSRRICPLCHTVLTHLGIAFTEEWTSAIAPRHWIDPWDGLDDAPCKPPPGFRRDDTDDDDGHDGQPDGVLA